MTGSLGHDRLELAGGLELWRCMGHDRPAEAGHDRLELAGGLELWRCMDVELALCGLAPYARLAEVLRYARVVRPYA